MSKLELDRACNVNVAVQPLVARLRDKAAEYRVGVSRLDNGVTVIDAKRYRGKAEIRKQWFGDARLFIDGRDRSKLADGLARQVANVQTSLSAIHPEAIRCEVEGPRSLRHGLGVQWSTLNL